MLAIPQWPTPDTPAGQTFFANALAIVKAWRSYHVPNPMVFGFLANAEAESSLDPAAKGDHDERGEATAHGLYQLHGDRTDVIKAALDIDIVAGATIEAQVEAAMWELTKFSYFGLAEIKAATTAADAAIAICQKYERAGAAGAAQKRAAMAERWVTRWAALNP